MIRGYELCSLSTEQTSFKFQLEDCDLLSSVVEVSIINQAKANKLQDLIHMD